MGGFVCIFQKSKSSPDPIVDVNIIISTAQVNIYLPLKSSSHLFHDFSACEIWIKPIFHETLDRLARYKFKNNSLKGDNA